MANGPLQIKAISGHAGTVPGKNTSRDYDVCKLIDVTTCIGCKACEVACLEWNGYPFRETVFDNTYQTMPDTGVELLQSDPLQRIHGRERQLQLADAQGSVHALRRSGMLAGVPRPMARSCNTPTASSIFSRNIASAASIV